MPEATLIYHGSQVAPDDFGAPGARERHTTMRWRPVSELFSNRPEDAPIVVLMDGPLFEHTYTLSALPAHLVVVAVDDEAAEGLGARADLSLVGVSGVAARGALLEAACTLAASRLTIARMSDRLARTDREFHELSRISMALMHECDRRALLHLILTKGKGLTDSDGGGLLFVETDERGVTDLAPVLFEFDSLPELGLPDIRFAIDRTTIVGTAAHTKEPVVVADIHALPAGGTYTGSAEFERRYQYYGKSLLAVPMLDQNETLLGVLFFINRKSERDARITTKEEAERFVLPYTEREVRLVRALASQAAVSIENGRLHAQIETLLDSMVKAAVSAIDERDPTTAGHSLRVAALTTALAETVDAVSDGPFRDVRFTAKEMRELHFAALLHDLGKVTVREDVLLKATKLPPTLWERVSARFDLIRRTMQLEHAQRYEARCRVAPADLPGLDRLDAELAAQLEELERLRGIVAAANQPTMLDTPPAAALDEIAARTFEVGDGAAVHYLTPEELHYLQIPRGSLDDRERAEIEAHVHHTQRFLSQISWTNDLKDLVTYACGHHEKLNGSGYPSGLRGKDIPIQTRMITLADIFDALTESDRPYKPAVPPEKALEIIESEADAGGLDRDLVAIMARSQVYRRILDSDWRTL